MPFGGQLAATSRVSSPGASSRSSCGPMVWQCQDRPDQELAIAGMQSQGVVPRRFRPRGPVRRVADPAPGSSAAGAVKPDPVEADPLLEATMRQLAEHMSVRASEKGTGRPAPGIGSIPLARPARCTVP